MNRLNVSTKLVVILTLLFAWTFLSRSVGGDVFPGPSVVLIYSFELLQKAIFWSSFLLTISRVALSVTISFVIAIVFKTIYANAIFKNVVDVFCKSLLFFPAIVAAYFFVVLFGAGNLSIIATPIVLTVPQIFLILRSKILDGDLEELAAVFHISRYEKFINITFPQMYATIKSSFAVAFSTSWKLSLLVETIAMNNGIGYQIYYRFQSYSMVGIISWTICFVVTLQLIVLILKYIERRLVVLWLK